MREQILSFGDQLKKGVLGAKNVSIDPTTYERVVVCGMGGSSIPGEMLLFWQEVSGMPPVFYIHRDYDLPDWVSENDLIVCVSWSGNTAETISSFKSAVEKGLEVVVITKGGQLKALAWEKGSKLIILPDENIPPRLGAGYMIGALFGLLGAESRIDFKLSTQHLEGGGKELASETGTAIPLIYGSAKWRRLANFWKILFNENAKVPAFWNFFPSLAHNEIAGFNESFRKIIHPILIKETGDDKRHNGDIDTAIAIFKELGYNYSIVNLSAGGNALEKMLNGYVLGFWASYYLANNLGVDPADTTRIEEFKRLKNSTSRIKLAK